jgi:hypothetical protein
MENTYQIPSNFCSDAEQQAFWAKVVADQIASGMGSEKFCRHHQINFSTFHYRKYKKNNSSYVLSKNNIKPKSEQRDKDVSKFISLQVATDIPSNMCHKENAVDAQDKKIEIVFKNGHKVILPLVISETNLSLLIKIIGGLQC